MEHKNRTEQEDKWPKETYLQHCLVQFVQRINHSHVPPLALCQWPNHLAGVSLSRQLQWSQKLLVQIFKWCISPNQTVTRAESHRPLLPNVLPFNSCLDSKNFHLQIKQTEQQQREPCEAVSAPKHSTETQISWRYLVPAKIQLCNLWVRWNHLPEEAKWTTSSFSLCSVHFSVCPQPVMTTCQASP